MNGDLTHSYHDHSPRFFLVFNPVQQTFDAIYFKQNLDNITSSSSGSENEGFSPE